MVRAFSFYLLIFICLLYLLLFRCCSQQQPSSQQQRRHHRRRLDRTGSSASGMSASTLGGHTGNQGAWQNHYSCRHGDTSSICSGSSSTISLATELVTLDLDSCSHLGITIVGHSNASQGDCGIFVGCVKKGGAAARSGRIEPGDLILEVNDIDLERMSNEQALTVLKAELARGGLVRILVAKYWDMNDGSAGSAEVHKEPLYEAVGSVRSVPMSRPGSVCAGHILDPAESVYRASLPQHSMTLDRRLRSAAASRLGGAGNPSAGGGGMETGTARPFRGIELIDWIQGQVSGLGGEGMLSAMLKTCFRLATFVSWMEAVPLRHHRTTKRSTSTVTIRLVKGRVGFRMRRGRVKCFRGAAVNVPPDKPGVKIWYVIRTSAQSCYASGLSCILLAFLLQLHLAFPAGL